MENNQTKQEYFYKLRWRMEPGKYTKADLQAAGDFGGCDAVIMHSLIFPEDGSRSECIVSLDGATGQPLPPVEHWKSWALMAKQLSETDGLDPTKRAIALMLFELQRIMVLSAPGATIDARTKTLLDASVETLDRVKTLVHQRMLEAGYTPTEARH